jgi:hypothetical protein
MSDIVDRLRNVAHTHDEYGVHSEIELEAAKEIEILKAALKEAADALHFGGQKARSPSFASKIFLAESNARKVLDEGK